MAAYVTQKTWVSGEILFAADLNAEFVAVKNSLNGIDQAQLNSASVGTAQIIDANVTKAKLAPNLIDHTKIELDTIIRIAQDQRVGGTGETSQNHSTLPVTIGSGLSITPLLTTAIIDLRFDIWLRSADAAAMVGFLIEADKNNDATYEAEIYRWHAAGGTGGFEANAVAGGANERVPLGFGMVDSGGFAAGTPVNYRVRMTDVNDPGAAQIVYGNYCLRAVCYNVF
jgi:hypothetical protein